MVHMEEIKKNSKNLRGNIANVMAAEESRFDQSDFQLLKFHGVYQQDDRDQRTERRRQKQERAFCFMVRSKIPGGRLTAKQYLIHDHVVKSYGNNTLRITTRQGLQTHFVLKGDLQDCIAEINRSGITTWGACGDVVRNVMASPWPFDTPVYQEIQKLSEEIKDVFKAKSHAYSEIWLNGEKLDVGNEPEDEIYGETFLPRKFKFAIAVPPNNDVDVYSQDAGLVPHIENNQILGYTVLVGGGLGMTHKKRETYPVLAKPLLYVPKEYIIDVCKAILTTQRDYGERQNRKRARMKYLIEDKGLAWFKSEVLNRLDSSIPVEEPRSFVFDSVSDLYGWHEQGDGKLFLTVWVPQGRIQDTGIVKYKHAFREIAEQWDFPIRLTPNCNIIFYNIDPSLKNAVEEKLKEHNIPLADQLTEARRLGIACVANPTCTLALAESERVYPQIMDQIDEHLRALNLQDEKILIRMTGCPNGCARPYNADISFVGKSPDMYYIYVGGSYRGDRLAGLEKTMVHINDIPALVRTFLDEFVAHRQEGESFTDYWGRTHSRGPLPHPDQFHEEPAREDKVVDLLAASA